MKRAAIEQMMKQNNISTIGLIYNETDALGVYCELKSGYLCDYEGHRVNRTRDIWGYVSYADYGKGYLEPHKVKFDELNKQWDTIIVSGGLVMAQDVIYQFQFSDGSTYIGKLDNEKRIL